MGEQESLAARIARIDERSKSILDRITIYEQQLESYVTKDEFSPVRNIVYGATGLILVGVLTAVLTLVIVKANDVKPAAPTTNPTELSK